MLSNEVARLEPYGDYCHALLLTPKARVIAPLVVHCRDDDDFLLVTEQGLGDAVRRQLLRARLRSRVEIEPEEHTSTVVFEEFDIPSGATGWLSSPAAGRDLGWSTDDYGAPATEVLNFAPPDDAEVISENELERLRIQAGTPRWGREIDDRVLPAEAGLTETHVSFTKGCYPGQEPIARLHYRGHVNRSLRRLAIDAHELPEYDAELRYDGKVVGRVTSAARTDEGIVALAYVRTEVPAGAELGVGHAKARSLD